MSVSSTFPPGNAVCPGWDLSSFDRVVKSTRSWLDRSYKRTKTAASLDDGFSDLNSFQ
jgi:hypothetical protein